MMPSKKLSILLIVLMAGVMAACSGLKTTSTGGGGNGGGGNGTGGTFSIGGTVSGLQGTGLVLSNGTDTLAITPGGASVAFTFKNTVAANASYNVVVTTQPSNPAQTCSVTNGTGLATANVTNILVSCAAKFTIGGMVSGLTGSGLVLQNMGGDNLPINASGTFTFATPVPGAYNVTVLTQPSNPAQSCQVMNGQGTATANVTNVTVSCSSGYSIGGTISNLSGVGLVLQDNGGDNLSITGTGSVQFTFPTLVTGSYNVTVQTQPSNPTQNCVVSNGTGTATTTITNVQIACGNLYPIGGEISGLVGTGLVLEDTLGTGTNVTVDRLPISGAGTVDFTFKTLAPQGTSYAVSVVTQPTGPAQTCSVVNGTGTANGGVTTVQVVCPAPGWTIGGTLVGMVDHSFGNPAPVPGDFVELQNNGGDNLIVTGDNQGFTFPSPVTNNGQYNVSIFLQPTSQTQGCTAFYYLGVATANVNDVIIDCQHNDWTWLAGPNTNGSPYGSYGVAVLPPPSLPALDNNNPGGRTFGVTWTDNNGFKWMYGGWGLPVAGASPEPLPYYLEDLWVCIPNFNTQPCVWIPANLPVTTTTFTAGNISAIASTVPLLYPGGYSANASTVTYTTGIPPGTTQVIVHTPGGPGARWGSATWVDGGGNLYLFGGQGNSYSNTGLLNDLWKFTPGHYDTTSPAGGYVGSYEYTGDWTFLGGSPTANATGTYGTQGNPGGTPGARWGAAYCTDASGTVWMFGGQGYDSTGNVVLLNDLWKYSGGQWTWVGPSGSNVGQKDGAYGTLGTGSTSNFPGGRQTALLVPDNSGNLWLFGGLGLDSIGTQNPGTIGGLPSGTAPEGALLNDMWEYNIATQAWTWVSGGGATGLANQVGMYGMQQVAAAGFFPGSRWSSSGWIDSNGNIWIFGGWGYASSLAQSTGFLNDIWEFEPSTGLWTWWKGSSNVNQAGNYPTQFPDPIGLPFVGNTPGGRSGVAFWPQNPFQPATVNDYVWAFGGQAFDSAGNNGYMADTWKYLQFPY
ncbi:MAG TPA: kelch repeat-containing protein [Terriglobales bacterium]|nr:kelch repeat-containing protein [Terriglobales bacterium]